MDLLDYKVTFHTDKHFWGDVNNPEDYVVRIEADIMYDRNSSAEAPDYQTIAILNALSFRVSEAPISPFHIFDCHSDETSELFDVLFDLKTDSFKDTVLDQFDILGIGDILYVDTLKIPAKHRGRNLGLLTARELIKLYGGGCDLVICKPFPMQFSGQKPNEGGSRDPFYRNFTKDQKLAFQKIRAYWRTLGFKRIPKSDFYAMRPFDLKNDSRLNP